MKSASFSDWTKIFYQSQQRYIDLFKYKFKYNYNPIFSCYRASEFPDCKYYVIYPKI